MKKINFVSRNFYPDSPGGCEKVFYEVYKRAKKDYNIRVISSYKDKKKFPKNRLIFPKKKFKNSIKRYFYYLNNMTRFAHKKEYDLIHANNIECLRLSKKPFILTIHHVGHFIDNNIRKQTIFTKLMRKALVIQANRTSKVITVSNTTKNDLISIGVKKEKIIVIPNGIDLKQFNPIKKRQTKKFIISHVSRISPEKAQHFTINALKKLDKRILDNIELRFIGYVSDKDYYKVLERKKWIKYYTNLSDSEFSKKLAESNLVVFPTQMSEGFGLVVLEAMACGVPVIASDQPSIREAGGKVCKYFKQSDEKDFTKKVMKLYNNPKLRNDLIKKGLVRVKKFSWDSVYKKHKKIYEELLK